ncbi:sensor histidine kinase [Nocardiopsis chromatogenes]|uniref:sensor histidine kinase n=1 Tax=Nocardiopsis chromatogenes TaxID=280239 RepID=UPI000348FE72|nr:ATP-binding protein [Nocardiopsis chromatogenes]
MHLSRLRVPPGHAALACAALAGLAAWWWPPSLLALPVAALLTGRLSPDPRPAAALYCVGTAAWALRFVLAGEPVGMWVVGGGLVLLTLLLPWLVGLYLRSAAALERAGWERARRLEREARLVAERARMRERSRIAQDLHDAVGHELSLLALRAGGLEMASDLSEERRGQAAELREAAGRAADRLVEAVGVLRDDAAPEAPPLGPLGDGEAALDDLAERARASGMDVALTDGGALRDVPVLVERAAHRVVQEALTNAAKHAPGAAVRVSVESAPGAVTVRVHDSGPAADAPAAEAPSGGTGLVSLRERVRLVGGVLDAGPDAAGGGWTVTARLPLQAPEALAVPGAWEGRSERSGGGGDAADTHLRRARRRAGWAVAAAVGLPLAMIAAGYAASIAFTVYQAKTATLEPSVFAALEPGQARAEVEDSLPERDLYDGPLGSGGRPADPDGLECVYYRSDDEVFGGGGERYRLCFDDEELVSAETVGR